jgi:hypothetical protein
MIYVVLQIFKSRLINETTRILRLGMKPKCRCHYKVCLVLGRYTKFHYVPIITLYLAAIWRVARLTSDL